MGRPTPITVFLLFLALAAWGCADEREFLLDDEFQAYRYEQERGRREDLERLYREEAARSEELTRKILALRAEIAAKQAEVRDLEKRVEDGKAGGEGN